MFSKTILFHIFFIFFFFVLVTNAKSNGKSKKNTKQDYPLCRSNAPYLKQGENPKVPLGTDAKTGVKSKDVKIFSRKIGVSDRIYIPKTASSSKTKLPLLFYFHRKRFCIARGFSDLLQHAYSNMIASKANAIVLSVEYELSPRHKLPPAYEESWKALQWVSSHINNSGSEVWLRENVDFKRVFLMGDSSGANIAHNLAMRAGFEKLDGLNLAGIILIHPFIWAENPISVRESKERAKFTELWHEDADTGLTDPRINPAMDSSLSQIGTKKVLVCIAGKDLMTKGNFGYVEALKKSGWKGNVEVLVAKTRPHLFHLFPDFYRTSDAQEMLKKISAFVK